MSLRGLNRILLLTACVLAGLVALPSSAEAKDLRGRFALGVGARLSPTGIFSAKITLPSNKPTLNVQVQALVGFALMEQCHAFQCFPSCLSACFSLVSMYDSSRWK